MAEPDRPYELAQRVEEHYRSYLETTFAFSDPELRASFAEALKGGHLHKGPYLEATPTFRRQFTTEDIVRETLADSEPAFIEALYGTRLLYEHQSAAIRRARAGRNIIIATGTGSGKTEGFLYPILLSLYEEHRAGTLGPGVRALILYPMNALANDQRDRLAAIAQRLAEVGCSFRFTFGQYTGQTPEDERDARRNAADRVARRAPGELVFREEMRRTPPHILITNYSMLEYLLLRPKDSPLFNCTAPRAWSFIVLDEVHTYRGARAAEMGMLLRRLKQHLRESGKSSGFQFLATSATLARGEEDVPAVAEFARQLFGEPIDPDDILLPSLVPPEGSTPSSLFSTEDYALLEEILWEQRSAAGHPRATGIALPADLTPTQEVGAVLRHDERSLKLRRLLSEGPLMLEQAAGQIFPDLRLRERIPWLNRLVSLLMAAEDPQQRAPLLSVRYHFLLRALEGAYIAYYPRKRVVLNTKEGQPEGALFEVALCRECGQHYLLTRRDFAGGLLTPPVRDPTSPGFGVTYLRPLETEADQEAAASDPNAECYSLCTVCGCTWRVGGVPPASHCSHPQVITVLREESPHDEDRVDQIIRCGACGYEAPDPVREVVHGTDGPHTVIATTLHQYTPPERRKLLAFADGRQEAAFFAWYLDRTYRDIRDRNLIYRAVAEYADLTPEGLTLGELAPRLAATLRSENAVPATMGDVEIREEAWRMLYRELLTDARRLSLEGVGLVRWTMRWPDWHGIPEVLKQPPWSLDDAEARALMSVLLDTLRQRGAVELLADPRISLNWSDLGLSAGQSAASLNTTRDLVNWAGPRTYRVQYLTKFLEGRGLAREEAHRQAVRLLRELWGYWHEMDRRAVRPEERVLLHAGEGRRLNPLWLRVQLLPDEAPVYRCSVCGRIHPAPVPEVCTRGPCPGILEEVRAADLKPNHYRRLYTQDLPAMLRVEEHTAQLDADTAWRYQDEFRTGHIHVLSSSTTFEVGVDLGDLDLVFLRNVPPEAFNYQQRVGRAGRRRGMPGLAITYCKRSPHDLYHFLHPEKMIAGGSPPPAFRLDNEKIITRHMVAYVLARFFRSDEARFADVESLLGGFESPDLLAVLSEFVEEERESLESGLRAIVPAVAHDRLRLDDGSWIDPVLGPNSKLAEVVDMASSDWRRLRQLEEEARDSGTPRGYSRARWAASRRETIAREDVLSFLSRTAVIPKYGFPVDVVELDTMKVRGSDYGVDLQRDLRLAIAEFAPSSKIVANKREWESCGLKRVPEREWQRRYYKRCDTHGVYVEWEAGQAEPALPCGDNPARQEYVVPRFGFLTGPKPPVEPKGRPARVFTTRPYLAEHLHMPEPLSGTGLKPGLVIVHKTSPGRMVVLCQGRRGDGFYVCPECGAGYRSRPSRMSGGHDSPLGTRCRGTLMRVALGHEFVTDVLRLQFVPPVPDQYDNLWLSYGLAFAIVEGAAQTLGVPSEDIDTTVTFGSLSEGVTHPVGAPRPIILYDDVPGGAGLVARLEDPTILRTCLEQAYERVSGKCGCPEESSCYGCLRSYRNQFAHHALQRGAVAVYLKAVLDEWQ